LCQTVYGNYFQRTLPNARHKEKALSFNLFLEVPNFKLIAIVIQRAKVIGLGMFLKIFTMLTGNIGVNKKGAIYRALVII
jgi:hypothetical protein